MNIQLYINGKIADLDDDTAIGMQYNGFQFSDAGNIHLTYSNTFTLPITKVNRSIFGIVDDMGVNSAVVSSKFYDNLPFSMYIDGAKVISGKIYVSEITDRISVYIINMKDFTEMMGKYTMFDVTQIIVTEINKDLITEYPSGASFDDVIGYCATGEEDIWLPYATGTLLKQFPYAKIDNDGGISLGNLYDDTDNADDKEQYNIDNETTITTEFITDSRVVGDYKAGHFYVNMYKIVSTVFNLFGYVLDIDADILTEMQKQYIRMQDIVLYKNLITGYYSFRADDLYKYSISSEGSASSKNITFLDLFKVICQEFCLVFDIDGDTIYFHSLNDIKTITPKVYDNGDIVKRSFMIEGLSQDNKIKYQSTGDGNEYAGSRSIECSNSNIASDSTDIITIKRFIAGYLVYIYEDSDLVHTDTYSLNTSDVNINNMFVIVQKEATQTPFNVNVRRYLNGQLTSTDVKLYRAVQPVVGNSSWWDMFAYNCQYPEVINVEAYIKSYDLIHFSSFNYVRFSTLAGTWYIQSISGWNPRLTNNSVTVSAIRIR